MIVFFREPVHWKMIIGIVTAFTGAVVTITHGNPAAALADGISAGGLYLSSSVSCWAAYTIIARQAMKGLPALTVLIYSSIVGRRDRFSSAIETSSFFRWHWAGGGGTCPARRCNARLTAAAAMSTIRTIGCAGCFGALVQPL